MDERQLAELFRDAADGGPPPRFGHTDVVAASRRATARRRAAITGGSAIAAAVLVGGIVIGGGLLPGQDAGTRQASTAGGGEAPAAVEDQQGRTFGPMAAPPSTAVDNSVPEAPAEQGRTASGKVVPWPGLRDGDARAGCGPMDRELVEQLREFPAIPALAPPLDVPDQCPAGARAAALPVRGGLLYVVLAPVRGDGPADGAVGRDDGAAGYFVYTPKGSGLLVLSVPTVPGSAAPHAAELQRIAEAVAQRH